MMTQNGKATTIGMLHVATDPVRWRILQTLAKRPLTARELADSLDISTQHAAWHAKRLVAAGLAKVKFDDPPTGSGMRVQRYFIVPLDFVVSVGDRGATVKKQR